MKENEMKILLKKVQYDKLKLIASSSRVSDWIQTNYYFDTDGFILSQNKITLRIRVIRDRYELTLKTKNLNESQKGVIVSNEINWTIRPDVYVKSVHLSQDISLLMPELKKNLPENMQKNKFKCIGFLNTHRIKFKPIQSLPPAELDKSDYLNTEEYELEWELKKIGQIDEARVWLKKNRIEFNVCNNMGQSKYQRFISRFQTLKCL